MKVASGRSRRVYTVVMAFFLAYKLVPISPLSSKPELSALALGAVIIPPHTEVCPLASILDLATARPRPLATSLKTLAPSLSEAVWAAAMDRASTAAASRGRGHEVRTAASLGDLASVTTLSPVTSSRGEAIRAAAIGRGPAGAALVTWSWMSS